MPDGAPATVLQRCPSLGYQHHVFVSWSHELESRGVDFVSTLAASLEDKFRTFGPRGSPGAVRRSAPMRARRCTLPLTKQKAPARNHNWLI